MTGSFADTRLIDNPDPDQPPYEEIPGTQRLYPADSVIVAISQGPRSYIVSTTTGIQVDPRGLVVTDIDGHTTREGVFASGDVVSGARTVVEAALHSKSVARNIAEYVDRSIALGNGK